MFKQKLNHAHSNAVLAKLLLAYVLWGILIFPLIMTGYNGLERFYQIFIENKNVASMFYSFIISVFLFALGVYALASYLSKRDTCIYIYIYILVVTVVSSIIQYADIEQGWKEFIFFYALMFYPTKYTLFSLLFLLFFQIFLKRMPEDLFEKYNGKVKYFALSIITIYFGVVTLFPWILKYNGLDVL